MYTCKYSRLSLQMQWKRRRWFQVGDLSMVNMFLNCLQVSGLFSVIFSRKCDTVTTLPTRILACLKVLSPSSIYHRYTLVFSKYLLYLYVREVPIESSWILRDLSLRQLVIALANQKILQVLKEFSRLIKLRCLLPA